MENDKTLFSFARPLASRVEAKENEPVHFEARLQPASDVKMTVEWLVSLLFYFCWMMV